MPRDIIEKYINIYVQQRQMTIDIKTHSFTEMFSLIDNKITT